MKQQRVYVLLRKTTMPCASFESGVAGVFTDLDMAVGFAKQVTDGIAYSDERRKFVYDEPPQDNYNTRRVKFQFVQSTHATPRFIFECTEELLLTPETKQAE